MNNSMIIAGSVPLAALGIILVIHRFISKMRDRQDTDDHFQKQEDEFPLVAELPTTSQASSVQSFNLSTQTCQESISLQQSPRSQIAESNSDQSSSLDTSGKIALMNYDNTTEGNKDSKQVVSSKSEPSSAQILGEELAESYLLDVDYDLENDCSNPVTPKFQTPKQ